MRDGWAEGLRKERERSIENGNRIRNAVAKRKREEQLLDLLQPFRNLPPRPPPVPIPHLPFLDGLTEASPHITEEPEVDHGVFAYERCGLKRPEGEQR
jgi:hypothetical protein